MATVSAPVKLALTNSLQDLGDVTPVGKIRSWTVRFANVGSESGYGDLVLTDGTTVITRAKNYPVPYQQAGSAPDMEERLTLAAGWKIQAKASASVTVEASGIYTEIDATDLA